MGTISRDDVKTRFKGVGTARLRARGSMRVMVTSRRAPEASIVVLRKLRQVRIRVFHRADATQAELLDEPVLQRLVRALDAAFGRRRIHAPRTSGSPSRRVWRLSGAGKPDISIWHKPDASILRLQPECQSAFQMAGAAPNRDVGDGVGRYRRGKWLRGKNRRVT